MIEGVILTPLSIIDTKSGDVLHAMKETDKGYSGFGEAYFSTIESGAIKGWKRHQDMVLNLVVPVGAVRFVLFDDRKESKTKGALEEIILSRSNNYGRLTVPPRLWMGFQGVGENEELSMLLNIANIPHDPDETDVKKLDKIKFDWSK